jgi:L-iditol 2-dehydrogenase
MTESTHWRYRYNTGLESFEKEDEPSYELEAENQVIIKPLMVGVCGSDLSKMANKVVVPHLGHEWVGVIEKVGQSVTDFTTGEIVTSVANLSCGTCKHCISKNSDQCKQRELLGGDQSILSSQVKIYDHDLLKVPQELDLASITLLEVAYVGDCAFHQAVKTGLDPQNKNQKTIIFGAGPIGLMTALALKERGLESHLIEIEPNRIEAAKNLGLNCSAFAQEIVIRNLFGKCDAIFDCTGDAAGPGALKVLPLFAKMDAVVLIVGKYHNASLNELDFGSKGLRISWVANHKKDNFKESIQFWQARISQYSEKMIKTFRFQEINKAFDAAKDRTVLKAMLRRDHES